MAKLYLDNRIFLFRAHEIIMIFDEGKIGQASIYVLNSKSHIFAIDLAALMARYELKHFGI